MKTFAHLVSAIVLGIAALSAHSAKAGIIVNLDGARAGMMDDYREPLHFPPAFDPNRLGPGWFGANLYTDSAPETTLTYSVYFKSGHGSSLWLEQGNYPTLNPDVTHACSSEADCAVRVPDTPTRTYSANTLIPFVITWVNTRPEFNNEYVLNNGENQVPMPYGTRDYSYWLGFERNALGDIVALIIGVEDPHPTADRDFDDLMIKIQGFDTVSFVGSPEVPLPASMWLFASAIAALAGRRKLAR